MVHIEVWSSASEDAHVVDSRTVSTAGTARMLANSHKANGRFVVIADGDDITVA